MISLKRESTAYYVACTVSQASNWRILIRIMNTSNCAIETAANKTLAEFTPVSDLVSTSHSNSSSSRICTTLGKLAGLTSDTMTEYQLLLILTPLQGIRGCYWAL